MSDEKENMGVNDDASDGDADVFVLDAASAPARVTERLRQAVKRAGGNAAVSARSGVKTRTLSHYLSGREMKQSAMIALADACRVSVEWLATGRGDPDFGWATMAMQTQTPDGPKPSGMKVTIGQQRPLDGGETLVKDTVAPEAGASLKGSPKADTLFATLDMTRMGEALKAAAQAFASRGVTPSWRRLAQVAAILYDAEREPAETVRAHDENEAEN